jgi:hypothetical protein
MNSFADWAQHAAAPTDTVFLRLYLLVCLASKTDIVFRPTDGKNAVPTVPILL